MGSCPPRMVREVDAAHVALGAAVEPEPDECCGSIGMPIEPMSTRTLRVQGIRSAVKASRGPRTR
eukprot:COSAG01_NODE_66389_length_270_cov_0.649123_1_plen_64_part_01